MRQSRRTKTRNRRGTLARRWRPWLGNDVLDVADDAAVPATVTAAPVERRTLPQDHGSLREPGDSEQSR